jgi:HSP20 family protein
MSLIPYKRDSAIAKTRDSWRRFDRDFDQLFQLFNGEPFESNADYAPSLDVKETKDAYMVQADLPGVNKKDIQVRVENGILTLAGSRKAEHEEESRDKTWHRVERSWGSYTRAVRLGDGVDAAKVSAEYKDGVLTVTVPKKEETLGRIVEVK